MRLLRFLPLLLTLCLVWLLDTGHGILPPLGRFLDPVSGAMNAAEPADKDFSSTLKIKGLQQPVAIDLEDRLVPHITAQNDHDLYLAQGYIHAYFRLWQMDMQTRAAAGRVSEVAGRKAFKFDQGQRRKGMVYAAEKSLAAMEADRRTRAMLDAYTAGINNYIRSLSYRDLPLEYKLMDFKPEPWTNLKCALLLKYMADDLTGASDDIAYTLLRDQLGQEQFDFLFPEKIKGSKPVIPQGTKFEAPSLKAPAYPGDSVWVHVDQMQQATGNRQNGRNETTENDTPIPPYPPRGKEMTPNNSTAISSKSEIRNPESESGIGSNNWAISGTHTASGRPILCNDPHLGLNLPSLWFEVQLTAPGINTYGASLPGAPGVVIGFNEQISWGFTNNYRDVKDYYAIDNNDRDSYRFNERSVGFDRRAERIKIKDSLTVIDTVLYTIHGPVQYDDHFPEPITKSKKMLAMCWMAHRPTNELLALYLMNRAGNYEQFTAAIQHFECPAQNFAYADKTGNIAMWGQGQFINKWKGQGKFVMEGKDSLTLWGENIPMRENPHVLNPPQGYVASANQSVTDSTYPYWYNGSFTEWRSWEINEILNPLPAVFTKAAPHELYLQAYPGAMGDNIEDGMRNVSMSMMQNDTRSLLRQQSGFLGSYFADYDPHAIHHPSQNELAATNKRATFFQIFWSLLYRNIWQDEFKDVSTWPSSERTIQLMRADSTSPYFDDKVTRTREGLRDMVNRSRREAADSMNHIAAQEWYKVKNTSLTHLARIPAFSYTQLKTGGWGNTINAMKGNHGPSWRMIVEMDDQIKAYGVYPGGQSGNPGSRHYGDNVDKWVNGQYYELLFATKEGPKPAFKYRIALEPVG